jgi:hypothetical protein
MKHEIFIDFNYYFKSYLDIIPNFTEKASQENNNRLGDL